MAEEKKSQPPALQLANLNRALRARAREYAVALANYRESVPVTRTQSADRVAFCELELERAAVDFSRLFGLCSDQTYIQHLKSY